MFRKLKKPLVCFLAGSLLMTGGFLWKSGLAAKAWQHCSSVAGSFAGPEPRPASVDQSERRENDRRKKLEALTRLPADRRPPLAFRGQQKTLETELWTDCWSRKIQFPEPRRQDPYFLSFDVQPKAGHYIWFEEDELPIEVVTEPVNFGPKKSDFRLLGKEAGQSVKVTLEFRQSSAKDLRTQ